MGLLKWTPAGRAELGLHGSSWHTFHSVIFQNGSIGENSDVETISYYTTRLLCSLVSRDMFCTLRSLILTWKFFPLCPVSRSFFWISSCFQDWQWPDEETKERNCRITHLLHEIFPSLTKHWLKKIVVFFFVPKIAKHIHISCKCMKIFNCPGKQQLPGPYWQAVIWMEHL